ncbi:MAG: hypothetical protein PHG51_06315 [Candidatus Omnitrophica bacterium]|nr:hypothetical protein [Candidatus Omnitrophota bacterium]
MPDNKYLVGIQGETIVVGLAARTARMTKQEALTYAAHLVAMATTDLEKEFQPILDAVNQ